MRWWQRVLGLLAAALLAAAVVALVGDSVDELVDRVRALRGEPAEGVVVARESPGRRDVFPDVTVRYEVAGRTYERDVEGFLDVDERVEVRYAASDPAVSRVVGEGGPALLADLLLSALLVGAAPWGARAVLRDLTRPGPPRRREEPEPPEPERPGDRDAWRRRTGRGAVAGTAAGAALWVALAALLGAGPPREVATALLGLCGSGAAIGALVGLLASGRSLRRTGRALPYRLAVVALLLAVPGALLLAAALEG